MPTRIEPGDRTITWQESRRIAIGFHDCGVCRCETPEPSTADMVTYAQSLEEGRSGTLWPGRDGEQWMPPGWSHDDKDGLLCPDCTAAKDAALAARRMPPRNRA